MSKCKRSTKLNVTHFSRWWWTKIFRTKNLYWIL